MKMLDHKVDFLHVLSDEEMRAKQKVYVRVMNSRSAVHVLELTAADQRQWR